MTRAIDRLFPARRLAVKTAWKLLPHMVRARATGGYLLDKSRSAPLHAALLRYPIDDGVQPIDRVDLIHVPSRRPYAFHLIPAAARSEEWPPRCLSNHFHLRDDLIRKLNLKKKKNCRRERERKRSTWPMCNGSLLVPTRFVVFAFLHLDTSGSLFASTIFGRPNWSVHRVICADRLNCAAC
jgi:hypothetical protein